MEPFRYRPGQVEAIAEILGQARGGTRVILLEAPVGAGKSLVLAEVARVLHQENGWTGYYTTPQVNLVGQLRSDPLIKNKIQPIVGMDNYRCALDRSQEEQRRKVSEAWCIHGQPCDRCQGRGSASTADGATPCPACGGKGLVKFVCPEKYRSCQYFLDRKAAALGPLATMTLAYLLRVTRDASGPVATTPEVALDVEEPPRFQARDFLIIDEAYGLGEYARMLGIQAKENALEHPVWKEFWSSDLEPLVAPSKDRSEEMSPEEIRSILARMLEGVQAVERAEEELEVSGPHEELRRARRLNRARQLEFDLLAGIEDLDSGNLWVAQWEEDGPTSVLELSPVLSQKLLSRRLWPLGPKLIILSTATILDPSQFLQEVGLPLEGQSHLRPASGFPAENAPIFTQPCVDLSISRQERNLPEALEILKGIMDRHADRRGLLHVAGYRLQRRIYDALPEPYRSRVIIHPRGEGRTRAVEEWKRDGTRDSVLLSVGMEEGLDLKGELAHWQVIIKCPWADKSDRRNVVRKGMAGGERWYEMQALRRLLQSFGRIVRSDTDVGWTYVLDSSAVGLLNSSSSMLPAWARDRIEAGKRIAATGSQPPEWENVAA